MVKLIKKGGLRERANRSSKYKGSENTETTLKPNRYADTQKIEEIKISPTNNSEPHQNNTDAS